MQQQPPGGYQQGYPQQGYPQQPPPKQGMSTFAKVMLVLGCVALLGIGTCASCVFVGAKGVSDAATAMASAEAKTKAANEVARGAATEVPLKTLLAEYKDNEVRADQRFKDRYVVVEGKVDDVKKGIIGESFYVTLGTGAMLEIPQVQCFPVAGQEATAAQLSKGMTVKLRGRVDGLLMNVKLADCEIL